MNSAGSQQDYVLVEGDMFLVTNSFGDITGGADGLFYQDTRVLSDYRLSVAGQQPCLLSASVSQDNVYSTSHFTNHPLPVIGETSAPQGVLHIERRRFLWEGSMHECIVLTNYSDATAALSVALHFAGDFRDMFEVRGAPRPHRGTLEPTVVSDGQVVMSYKGLDDHVRNNIIRFSEAPAMLTENVAEFHVSLAPHADRALYVLVGPVGQAPCREHYRACAARARLAMRKKQRKGARLVASGRLFQNWLDKSRADVALLTADFPTGPYPYAGIPWYSTPFGRDAIITARQLLWLDPTLASGVLRYLAEHQAKETSAFRDAEPGKIMHETRQGEMSRLNELPFGRYYGGVDTTPLFIALAGAYVRRVDDWAFIDNLWPHLEAAAGWLTQNAGRNPDGFISYARGESTGLANQGWKDSHDSIFHENGDSPVGPISLIEVQGYAFEAYQSLAYIAEGRGDPAAALHWAQQAQRMQQAVERHFWQEDQHFYALALDGENRPCRVRGSNVGHLLASGLPAPERGRLVARQLLGSAFHNGWGVRTLAREAARYNPMSYHNGSVWPHDVALCALGIGRYGLHDGVVRLLGGVFEAASHFDMRLPELFCGFERAPGESPIAYPVACLPQAWAAGSVFMLLQACLGISIDAQRGKITITRPQLPFGISRLEVQHIGFGDSSLDLIFQRVGKRIVCYVERQAEGRSIQVDVRY
ncbi:amylo-alpha-1,6-glucosidase [Pseudomonas japonica]|uniref:amylo-alpha-1,6-glucosidase n=1 Tax=Pseudomonas japonica TaxID=256466 RepID=UPI0021595EA3|nr:amylo-alpha-1,6-glucosidase [Pseudomonas japonica]MBA1245391.1 amylo-alpha-1,6-glucosidase [Pseudomonas japonica]